jgi:hypothetical protein
MAVVHVNARTIGFELNFLETNLAVGTARESLEQNATPSPFHGP